ncbi:hypothetical protein D3C80_1813060 [compost metagenome]
MAVEAQAEQVLAHLQLQRFGFEARHLLVTEVLAVTDAVLGDHQHHLALLLVRLKSGGDAPHPVLAEELLGGAIEHVAKVGETVLGIGHIPQRDAPLWSPVGGKPCRLQRGYAVPPQPIEHGRRNKQRHR